MVDHFPNELLLACFKAIADLGDYASLFCITSTCHRWRNVALAQPDLWSNIVISSAVPLTVSLLLYQRSSPNLVDIVADFHGITIESDIIKLLEANRLRSLVISTDHIDSYETIARHCGSIVFPYLVKLFITLKFGLHLNDEPHRPFLHSDSLVELKLRNTCFQCRPVAQQLTLINVNNFELCYSELCRLFQASPCLSTLILVHPDVTEEEAVSSLIEVPSLRSLAIAFRHAPDAYSEPSGLSKLSTPNLEYLEIINAHLLSREFPPSINRPKLKVLRLEDIHIVEEDERLFGSLTSLKQLQLSNTSGNVFHLVPGMANGAKYPSYNLTSLVLSCNNWEHNADRIIQVISHSFLRGCHSFSLQLDERDADLSKEVTGLLTMEGCFDQVHVEIITAQESLIVLSEETQDTDWDWEDASDSFWADPYADLDYSPVDYGYEDEDAHYNEWDDEENDDIFEEDFYYDSPID